MSALNVVKQKDRIVVVTDGLTYDGNTGVVRGFQSKQATLPSLPCVIATQGAPLATPLFAHFVGCHFSSFDDLVAGIERAEAIGLNIKRLENDQELQDAVLS